MRWGQGGGFKDPSGGHGPIPFWKFCHIYWADLDVARFVAKAEGNNRRADISEAIVYENCLQGAPSGLA